MTAALASLSPSSAAVASHPFRPARPANLPPGRAPGAATDAPNDAAGPAAAPASTVAWSDLAAHRNYLVRFAQRRLRDAALAEDAVHDVFEAVLSGRAAFAGRAALRSWLTAVLKHKIVDVLRRQGRHQALDEDDADDGAAALASPQPGPDEIAEQRQRLARTLARIDTLPAGLRDVLRLRVLDERPTAEVCRALGISTENLFVRLHRARRQLAS